MKKITSVFLALALMLSLVVPTFADGAAVSLTVDKTTVNAGETVKVTVGIDQTLSELYGFQIDVNFDNSAFEFVSGEKGNSCEFANLGNVLEGQSYCRIGATLDFSTGALRTANKGTIYTLTFKAKSNITAGSKAFSIAASSGFKDKNNQTISSVSFGSSATVTVPQPVTGVQLNNSTLTMKTNDTATLTATVEPTTATNKSVTWKSSDSKIVAITGSGNSVTVTAKAEGDATITVTTADGGKTATCTVTVVNCMHEGTIKHVKAQAATCKATGNIEYWECADCYTKWSDAGKNTVVTDVTTAKVPHKFTEEVKNDKTLKTAGTCKTEAVYYKSCSVCGEVSKTDTFKGDKDASKHTGKNTYNSNGDGTHSVVCECGVTIKSEDCSGGTATCTAKAKCAKCGEEYGELAAHTYDMTKWVSDGTNHWHECTVCKEKTDIAVHNKAVAATCQHGNICDVCKRDDGAKASHTAAASSAYVSDANHHWQLCQWCGLKINEAAHTWNTPATEDDAVYCTICGYVKTAAKTPCEEKHHPGDFVADGAYHYTFCTECGTQVTKEGHTYGEATTVDGKKVEVCTKCGYVKTTTTTPITPVNPGKPGSNTGSKPVQSQKTFDAGIALYAGMAVLSLTGSAWMITKKKKEH